MRRPRKNATNASPCGMMSVLCSDGSRCRSGPACLTPSARTPDGYCQPSCCGRDGSRRRGSPGRPPWRAIRVHVPVARLVLALALRQDGQLAEARKALAAAILSYDWRPAQARAPDAWICHVLRREAEGLILPNLPAFLEGKYQPPDNDERLALLAAQLGIWEFRGLLGAARVIQANERQHAAGWERAIAEYRKLVTEKPADGAWLTT